VLFIVIGAVAVLLVMCCAVPFALSALLVNTIENLQSTEATANQTERLAVQTSTVRLEVENPLGNTTIRGADVSEIQVDIRMTGRGPDPNEAQMALNDISYSVFRQGERYIVRIGHSGPVTMVDLWYGREAEVDIIVPHQLNIDAEVERGELWVENVRIVDELFLSNTTENIVFSGEIGPDGTHRISSDSGEIELILDRSSVFELSAESRRGNVYEILSHSQGSRISIYEQGQGEIGRGVYGSTTGTPAARLSVESTSGDIVLRD